GALVADRRFQNQSRAMSFVVMSYLPVFVLLCLLATPAFKVWSMGPRDRFRTRDVYTLVVCTAMATAILTVLLLSLYAYLQLAQDSDDKLEGFATKLCSNFHDEVVKAYQALHEFVAVRGKPQAERLYRLKEKEKAGNLDNAEQCEL